MRSADYDVYDIRTREEKARTVLFEHLSALAQYVANDPSPSIYDRFTMLRHIANEQNWTDPRSAATRLGTILHLHRNHRSFVAYMGQAAAAVEKYAKASGAPVVEEAERSETLVVGSKASPSHIGEGRTTPATGALALASEVLDLEPVSGSRAKRA